MSVIEKWPIMYCMCISTGKLVPHICSYTLLQAVHGAATAQVCCVGVYAVCGVHGMVVHALLGGVVGACQGEGLGGVPTLDVFCTSTLLYFPGVFDNFRNCTR